MTDRPIDRLIDGCEWISANEIERSQIPSFYLTEAGLNYVLGEAAPVDKGNIHSVIILFLILFQIAVSKRCDRQILNVRAKTKYRIRNKGTWNQQV